MAELRQLYSDDDELPPVSTLFSPTVKKEPPEERSAPSAVVKKEEHSDDGAVSPSEAYLVRLRKRRTSPARYVDDEAVEENDEGESVHSMSEYEPNEDEYDVKDPFMYACYSPV